MGLLNFFVWVDFLRKIWEFIKKIFVKVLNFVNNIVKFFKDPDRLRTLKEDSNKLAISIKEHLDNGEYHVVDCLFDKETEQIYDMEEDALGIEAESLDKQTQQIFGDRDMIILK